MVKAGLGIAGLLIVVFSTVTTTFLDAYSAGISSESIASKLNGKWVAIAVTTVGTIAAMVYPMDNITDFLYLIGSVFAPMIAILIADYLLPAQRRFQRIGEFPKPFDLAGGFILYRLLMRVDTPVGNTLPDMLLTLVLCLLVGAFCKQRSKSVKS